MQPVSLHTRRSAVPGSDRGSPRRRASCRRSTARRRADAAPRLPHGCAADIPRRARAARHADAVSLRIGREQLAGDARRHSFPIRFRPRMLARLDRFRARLCGDTPCEPIPERRGRTKYVRRPSDEGVDDRTQATSSAGTPHTRRCALARRQTSLAGKACRAYTDTPPPGRIDRALPGSWLPTAGPARASASRDPSGSGS